MGLSSFDACDEVLDHLKSEALDRVGPWGLRQGSLLVEPLQGTAESDAAPSEAAGSSHSTTNVQEIGVDEPDVVKTDGKLIVTTAAGSLRVIDAGGGSPREIARLPLAEDGVSHVEAELLLSGDHVVVLVRGTSMVPYAGVEDTADSSSSVASDAPVAAAWWQPAMSVLLVDLSDPTRPVVESSLKVDGEYVDARMTDDTVRLVVRSEPDLPFEYPDGINRHDLDELTAMNRKVIRESTIEDWLPSYHLTTNDDESSGQLVGCEDLSRPDDFAGFSTLSVLTLDPAGLSDGDAVGVLTDANTVYASTDRLYVATNRWGEPVPLDTPDAAGVAPGPPPDQTTGIHAFDISGDDAAGYLASGEVKGRIIGPYAMSEHDDILRVATTQRVGPDRETTESSLITLEQRGDELVQIGAVGGLGRSEEIYAVRYFGTTGYVVTFRQVDPLYVLDLSDPTAPTVSGELKITGYSAYLHHLGDGRLIGVGQEATTEGRRIGAQVSLFDVSDPAVPTKIDGHVVPDAWTQAEWDPHAFLYWADTGALVVPMHNNDAGGALVLDVGGDSITEHGVITRSENAPQAPYAMVSRSLVIGDTLYTRWEDGLQANDLDGLGERGWLDLR